ncbi:MAG: type VI secretion system protein TssA [Phycisphaerales bacterium]
MAAIDVAALLAPVSPDAPAGADLSSTPDYLELFTLAAGKPEREIGKVKYPAEDPNWQDVRDRCVSLLKQTKDLRVQVLLIVAGLKTDGFPGLAPALKLLRGTLEQHWDVLYPRLDPDDNNDPLERVNIIGGLANPAETMGDPLRVIRRVREAPLTNSRQLGRFGLRDIAIASGEVPASAAAGQKPPDAQLIEGAFADTSVEDLQATHVAVVESLAEVEATSAFLDKTVGVGKAPNLDTLSKALTEAKACLERYLAKRGVGEAPPSADGTGGSTGGPSLSGEVRSTGDVLLAIDRICQYYERNEPSSPVPLLLKRAQRLVSKNFMEIIEDLSPDAMDQIRKISGGSPSGGSS